jgi:hypothetical protein
MSFESGLIAVIKKIKAGLEIAGEDALKVAGFLQQNQAEISGLAALAGSKTSSVVATSQKVLGEVITVVKGSSDAAAANGLSIPLNASVIAEVKALIAELEKL